MAIHRFDRLEVNTATRQLLVDGRPTPLGARAFDVLLALIERRERLVSKDELLDVVWPGLVVEENNLQVQISALRKILGQGAIATVAGRGYRFALEPADTEAPAAPLPPPQHNLPAQVASFVGRERESAAVRDLVARHRLVTLTGVGGIGKTTLALHVGRALADRFPDGAWFADLAPLSDPRLVPPAVASALAIEQVPGTPPQDLVARHVASRRLLLILDNCEHLLQACGEIAKLVLQAGPAVTIVTTSREPLRVSGEATYPVPPLAAPPVAEAADLAGLDAWPAVALFLDRARAAQPGFALTPRSAEAIARVCRDLDGIPLALELAAARVRGLTVETIAANLHDRFRLLRDGDPSAVPRQQTLRAAIDWSYDLLAPAERALLRRLSVFAGGFALEAAEAVGACGDVAAADVLTVVGHLADKSLLSLDARDGRYRLLETVRQYAQARLAEAGGEADTRDAHLRYYVALAQRAGRELAGPHQHGWNARLDAERENILLAHAHCRVGDKDGETAFILLYELRPWLARDRLEQWHRLCRDALAHPGAQTPTLGRSRALFAASFVAYLMGRYDDSRAWAEESLAIAQRCGDAHATSEAHLQLAAALAGSGSGDTLGHAQAAYEIGRPLGDLYLTCFAATSVGEAHAGQDRYDLAEPHYAEALRLARAMDSPFDVMLALFNLARCAIVAGNHAVARARLREAVALGGSPASLQQVQATLTTCAALAACEQHRTFAARLYGAAEAHRERHGVRLEPSDRPFHDRVVADLRSGDDPTPVDAAWTEGRALDVGTALAEAESWLAAPPPD